MDYFLWTKRKWKKLTPQDTLLSHVSPLWKIFHWWKRYHFSFMNRDTTLKTRSLFLYICRAFFPWDSICKRKYTPQESSPLYSLRWESPFVPCKHPQNRRTSWYSRERAFHMTERTGCNYQLTLVSQKSNRYRWAMIQSRWCNERTSSYPLTRRTEERHDYPLCFPW